MAREVINVGGAPNDGQGDPIRTSFIKSNNNFGELYARAQENPPATLVGTIGDSAGMYAYDSNYFYYCFANYDGVSTIWAQLAQIGNVSVQTVANGNTVLDIPIAGGNITLDVGGTSNVGVWATSGLTMKGNVLPSANAQYDLGSATQQWRSLYVSNSSIYLGGVKLTAGPGNSLQVGGANVILSSGGNNISVSNITASNVNATNTNVTNDVDVGADITAGGTITAGFFVGDGSGLTNLPGGGGNGGGTSTQIVNGFSKVSIPSSSGNVQIDVGLSAGVAKFTNQGLTLNGDMAITGNISQVTSTGNVTAPYFVGDGSFLTNVGGGGNYGNADVALFLTTYTGNIAANNVAVTNNANANILYANAVSVTNAVTSTAFFGDLTGDVTGDLTGNTTGIHNGLVGSIDILELSWDFGTITGTITNPMQWLINNIGGGFDAGTILAANATDIDIGVLTN